MNPVPQTAATTFALSSVFIFLLCSWVERGKQSIIYLKKKMYSNYDMKTYHKLLVRVEVYIHVQRDLPVRYTHPTGE